LSQLFAEKIITRSGSSARANARGRDLKPQSCATDPRRRSCVLAHAFLKNCSPGHRRIYKGRRETAGDPILTLEYQRFRALLGREYVPHWPTSPNHWPSLCCGQNRSGHFPFFASKSRPCQDSRTEKFAWSIEIRRTRPLPQGSELFLLLSSSERHQQSRRRSRRICWFPFSDRARWDTRWRRTSATG